MLHPSTKKLIDRLVEMTELGKLKWEETDQEAVTYSTEGYSVTLHNAPQEIVITSRDGKELERASEAELAATQDADGHSYTERVESMRREAWRIARGTEAAISSLLAGIELDGDTPEDDTTDSAVAPLVADPTLTDETPLDLEDSLTDETTALTASEVETDSDIDIDEPLSPEADAESLEAETADSASAQTEAVPSLAETEETLNADSEAVADPTTETLAPVSAETSADEPDDVAEAAPVAEAAGEVEDAPYEDDVDEPKMTAAVARLAEEVNGREQDAVSFPEAGALTAAAGGLAAAVAMAEDSPSDTTLAESTSIESEAAAPMASDTDGIVSEPAITEALPSETYDADPSENSVEETSAFEPDPAPISVPETQIETALEPPFDTATEPTFEAETETAPDTGIVPDAAAMAGDAVEEAAPELESEPQAEPLMDASSASPDTIVSPAETLSEETPVLDTPAAPEAAASEIIVSEDTSAQAYVPFGTTPSETAAPSTVLPDTIDAPVETSDVDTSTVETSAPEATSIEASTDEIAPETAVETPEAVAPMTTDAPRFDDIETETVSVDDAPVMEAAPTEPEPELASEPEIEIPTEAAFTAPVEAPIAPVAETVNEPISTATEASPSEPTLEAPDADTAKPEAASDDVPDAPATNTFIGTPLTETQTAPAQNFSLSGIGSGFGLTPLAATTEASGAPSPVNPTAKAVTTERVVIDAVDEVPALSPVETPPTAPSDADLSFPAVEPAQETAAPSPQLPTEPTPDPAPAVERAEADEADDAMLKPRTRFNPWD